MKNLFNRPTGSKPQEVLVLERELYQDIHGAQDRLLEEARGILESDVEEANRILELSELGFFNSESVSKKQEWAITTLTRIKVGKDAERYRREYPLNKFISQEQVNRICEKYGLVYSYVSHYISDIPKKNQDEILRFRVCKADLEVTRYQTTSGSVTIDREGFPITINPRTGVPEKSDPSTTREMVRPYELKIIAPESKFKSNTGFQKKGFELIKDDPIVLQPVIGGYLIVSAWGLEAGDPDVVNQNQN